MTLAARAADLGIWDWTIASGEMLCSPRFHEIFGFAPDQTISLDLVRAATHPDDLPRTAALRAQALDPGIRSREPYVYRILRTDGEVRWVQAFGEPVFEQVDGVEWAVRYVGTIQDITERKVSEQRLSETLATLQLAMGAARMAVWDWDFATETLHASPELNRLLGFSETDPLDIEIVRAGHFPGERERIRAGVMAGLERGETLFATEFRYRGPDQGARDFLLRCETSLGSDGRPARNVGILLDITEEKAAAERQRLLVNELNHRVKNTLAIVQSLAWATFRADPAHGAGLGLFDERLAALSRAHDLLTTNSWRAASITDIVETTLGPHSPERFRIRGPFVTLGPQSAVSLSLALHEMATNALKYGSLSVPGGTVNVDWSLSNEGLVLTWVEVDGPPVTIPKRLGFGTRMLRRVMTGEPDGSVTLDFAPSGFRCSIICRPEQEDV